MEREAVRITVDVTHLEMTQPRPAGERDPRIEVRRLTVPNPALNRFFYFTVGADWLWHSRRSWTFEQWRAAISVDGHETWIGYVDGDPAGYFELLRHRDRRTEVLYFGLLPDFVGNGLGAAFLEHCVAQAWAGPDTEAVFLSTCSLDHPRALPNYVAAGFSPVRTERIIDVVPVAPLEVWPGAATSPMTDPTGHRAADPR